MPPVTPPAHYQYSRVGHVQDVVSRPRPGLLLAGGGTDQDAAFAWLDEHANGGDVLVLRASGTDAYNPYIQGLGKVNSVATLVLNDREASSDPEVLDKIRHAEAIFIAGGDQGRYMSQWKDTPLQLALNAALAGGVPMGGTSAGLAVLGQTLFSAGHGTVTSAEAMADPHDPDITLDRDFVHAPHLESVITDTHFHQRDRMGRLMTFIEDAQEQKLPCVRGLAVDEATAVLMEGDGQSRLVGQGHAYLLERVSDTSDFTVFRGDASSTFDFNSWTGTNGVSYTLSLRDGRIESTFPEGVY